MKFRLIESGRTASYQDLGESLTKQHLDYVIHNVLDWKRHYSPTKITPEAVARACRVYDSDFTTQEYIAAINKYDALRDYIEKDRKKRYGGSVYRSSEIINIIENKWGSYVKAQDSGKGYIVVEYPDGWLDDDEALDREEYMRDEFDDCHVYVNRVGPNTLHVTSKESFD